MKETENLIFTETDGKTTPLLLTNTDKTTLVTFQDGSEYELENWLSEGNDEFITLKGYPKSLKVRR